MVGIVGRLIYYLQFWMPDEKRHPVALVCDEAHIYLPRDRGNPNQQRAVDNFEKIAKEGRKYGVSLMIVSQRPSDVSDTILSQCNNVMALRLTNSNDISAVKNMMPESMTSFMEMLPVLDIGEALVVGDAVLLPSRIRINKPDEKPLSATIDFWTEWSRKEVSPDWVLAAENMRRQRRKTS
jgi:DNA helicase HerA-like ATPase